MNKEGVTKRFRPVIRLGLSGAIIAGLGVIGAGALDAQTAWAGNPVSCSSTVALNNTYGYTYLKATGEVIGLSGSGCATSANPVEIFFSPLYSPSFLGAGNIIHETVTPSCPGATPHDCTFSFSTSWPSGYNQIYLTAGDAVEGTGADVGQEQIQFIARQAATGAGYTLSWSMWT